MSGAKRARFCKVQLLKALGRQEGMGTKKRAGTTGNPRGVGPLFRLATSQNLCQHFPLREAPMFRMWRIQPRSTEVPSGRRSLIAVSMKLSAGGAKFSPPTIHWTTGMGSTKFFCLRLSISYFVGVETHSPRHRLLFPLGVAILSRVEERLPPRAESTSCFHPHANTTCLLHSCA